MLKHKFKLRLLTDIQVIPINQIKFWNAVKVIMSNKGLRKKEANCRMKSLSF